MKRLIMIVLVALIMALATTPAMAENGPKVGDGPSVTSKWEL